MLALATGDIEPLLSTELTANSQLLYRRDVGERLSALAPWATFGADPYPVITADHVVWVVDGYTTSATYPYSQFVDFGGLVGELRPRLAEGDGRRLRRDRPPLPHGVGGGDDPILDAWEEIFPDLVEPIAAMPDELRDHLLYPPELLGVQSALLGRYHVDDAETLFSGTRAVVTVGGRTDRRRHRLAGTVDAGSMFQPTGELDLAGHLVSALPFSPGAGAPTSSARDQLAALALADHDGAEQIDLVAVEPESGRECRRRSSPRARSTPIRGSPNS